MSQPRSRVADLRPGDLLRAEIVTEPRRTYLPARNYRDSTVVSVAGLEDCRGAGRDANWPAGRPYKLTIREGNGNLLTAWWSGSQTHMQGDYRLVIDADCPHCNRPERWFDQQARLFGCNHCTYTSKERER